MFKYFPYTLYTLDDRESAQVVTNITVRSKIADRVKDVIGAYDLYDITDGETPEIIADKIYNNPSLHWLVLLFNEILDPRFDWPLSTNNLANFVEAKYGDINGIHHYEDSDGNQINGVLVLESSSEFEQFSNTTPFINVTNSGTGVVTNYTDSSNITITATVGGFKTGDMIKVYNTNYTANITDTTIVTGTPVTNFVYEDSINETKRRIKVLKPEYAELIINEFKNSLKV